MYIVYQNFTKLAGRKLERWNYLVTRESGTDKGQVAIDRADATLNWV